VYFLQKAYKKHKSIMLKKYVLQWKFN